MAIEIQDQIDPATGEKYKVLRGDLDINVSNGTGPVIDEKMWGKEITTVIQALNGILADPKNLNFLPTVRIQLRSYLLQALLLDGQLERSEIILILKNSCTNPVETAQIIIDAVIGTQAQFRIPKLDSSPSSVRASTTPRSVESGISGGTRATARFLGGTAEVELKGGLDDLERIAQEDAVRLSLKPETITVPDRARVTQDEDEGTRVMVRSEGHQEQTNNPQVEALDTTEWDDDDKLGVDSTLVREVPLELQALRRMLNPSASKADSAHQAPGTSTPEKSAIMRRVDIRVKDDDNGDDEDGGATLVRKNPLLLQQN